VEDGIPHVTAAERASGSILAQGSDADPAPSRVVGADEDMPPRVQLSGILAIRGFEVASRIGEAACPVRKKPFVLAFPELG
jgi:hypothetical protein